MTQNANDGAAGVREARADGHASPVGTVETVRAVLNDPEFTGHPAIASVRLENFKNFADETLRLGPFTVIVGANASGKSNIRDAFRFLHGVGRGYTLADIVGGRYGAGGHVEWEPIRGGANEIIRFGRKDFHIVTRLEKPPGPPMRHELQVGVSDRDHGGFRVEKEELVHANLEQTYTSHPGSDDPVNRQGDYSRLLLRIAKSGAQRKLGNRVSVNSDRPALTQIHGEKRVARAFKEEAQSVIDSFSSMRFLDLTPERMRQPSFPGQTVLDDSGGNLPTVLQGICADEKRRKTLVEWTRELTPMDVADFEFPVDPTTGRVGLAIRETDNRKVSAYGASDGTLRFLAMLAALLGPDPARLYFFEEIDNGLHPSRLHLLLDLIETQTEKSGVQVVTTTHSPELLTMMNDRTFENSSIVYRLPDSADSIIRPLREISRAATLRKSRGGLGRLLANGWMENILAFSNYKEEDSE